jgi:hypothetical protein
LPVPAAPVRMVIHPALVVAVHAHPVPTDTEIGVPVPPAAPMETVVGVTEKEQVMPAWFTVTVWFATVSVPVRAAAVFTAALIDTVPFPLPLAPAVIDNHDTLLVAVHAQPAVAVTVTGLVAPPPATAERVVGLTEKVHGAAA